MQTVQILWRMQQKDSWSSKCNCKLYDTKMIVEFEDGKEPKAVMNDVLKACKKVEPDCEIEL